MTLMAPARSPKRRLRAKTAAKQFRIGTTGWTVADLDDPRLEHQFALGRYEIVEGVPTETAPPNFDGNSGLSGLARIVEDHLRKSDSRACMVFEVDLILGQRRFGIVDALYLDPEQARRQRQRHVASGTQPKLKMGRIRVPPTLVIESVSLGHEVQDRETKRAWYEEFLVPNYWVLDGLRHRLECLRLEDGKYDLDCEGKKNSVVRPSAFPGLVIPLHDVWL